MQFLFAGVDLMNCGLIFQLRCLSRLHNRINCVIILLLVELRGCMKSYKIIKNFTIEAQSEDNSQPPKDCAKVKIIRASLCPSDIAVFQGKAEGVKFPIVPCRIAVGLVSESEDITLRKGQRVMLSPYTRYENGTYRIHGLKENGYLGDYVYVPYQNVYTIPDGIADNAVPFIEDIAVALNVIEKLDVDKTQYVMLYGCTSVNMIIAQLCIYYQAIPVIVDNDNERLAVAQEQGIYYCINYAEEEVLQKIKEITSGKLVEYLILDSDICDEIGRMLHYVRHSGKVAIVGYDTSVQSLKGDFSPVIKNNLTVYGISDGYGEIETAINMLATETVNVDKLVRKIINVEDVQNEMTEMAKSHNYYKTIIKC